MTLDDIKADLKELEDIKSDDESAHSFEDDIMAAFIQHVADTADPELAEMAKEVLKTKDIVFYRWFA